jgi:hypothetical protein
VSIWYFGIKVVENSEDDAVAALGVLKTTPHLQPPSDFPETALDHVGGADHLPDCFGELKDLRRLADTLWAKALGTIACHMAQLVHPARQAGEKDSVNTTDPECVRTHGRQGSHAGGCG